MEVPPAAEALYALPPSRFAAERDALARALAARGDPAAAAVRKLRRPVGLAWVLNRLAREHGPAVRALLEAGDRLRAGQRRALSGGGADALRRAEGEVRERVSALGSEAARILGAEGRPTGAIPRVELLLRATATAGEPQRDPLRRGVLAREPDVGTGELSGFALLPGGRPGAHAEAAAPRAPRAAAARAERTREARARKERERELARLRRAAAEALARAERAERAAAAAEEHARSAREGAAQARVEARRARDRVAAAERGER